MRSGWARTSGAGRWVVAAECGFAATLFVAVAVLGYGWLHATAYAVLAAGLAGRTQVRVDRGRSPREGSPDLRGSLTSSGDATG